MLEKIKAMAEASRCSIPQMEMEQKTIENFFSSM
jgi:hypothetical protein